MPRNIKIGTEIAHVTPDLDTTFKVKRSKVKVTRPLWLAVLAVQRGHRVSNGSRCVYDVYRVTACRPGRGASLLQLVISVKEFARSGRFVHRVHRKSKTIFDNNLIKCKYISTTFGT